MVNYGSMALFVGKIDENRGVASTNVVTTDFNPLKRIKK
jgi:hypothetical protein